MAVKENEIVLCTVKKIEGTTVFVDIESNGPGAIVFSEIAAGRIRNIREYVSPGKKIVCKVLRCYPDHAELSLRRVTGKEREEIQNQYRKQKTFENMLKAVSKDHLKIIEKVREEYELWEFFDKVKETPQLLDSFLKKSESESLIALLKERKDKEKIVKRIIVLKSNASAGVLDIKSILSSEKVNVSYLGSSQFSVSSSGKDYKEAENAVNSVLKKIETKAKEKKVVFELKDK